MSERSQRHAKRLVRHLVHDTDGDYPRHGKLDDHLPLFVLPIFALPKVKQTLVVFEPRYIAMCQRCMQSRQTTHDGESGFGVFGIVAPEPGNRIGSEDNEMPPLRRVGTYMRITAIEKHKSMSGRFVVAAVGLSRFQLEQSWRSDEGFMVGKASPIIDEEGNGLSPQATALADRVRHDFEELTQVLRSDGRGAQLFTGLTSFLAKNMELNKMPEDPVAFTWWIAEMLPLGEERYALLTTKSAVERLMLIEGYLAAMKQHLVVKGVPPARGDMN